LETERETGEKIPPLNAIIVNAQSGIPGSGCDYYLSTYLDGIPNRKLTLEQRKAMAEETMDEVWRFGKWQQILARYGLSTLEGDIPGLGLDTAPRKPNKGGWSSEPESEEHRMLKEWVAHNPQILKSAIPFRLGRTEWLFASADRADVMVTHTDGCVAVEVKAALANGADLERGIYQCVKYQALLRAELKAEGKIPSGSAVLVTQRELPVHLQQLADLLGVKVLTPIPS
jgi:hypothetical protein